MSNPFSTITTAGNGAGGALNLWRGHVAANGDLVLEESSYELYATVPKGEYRLRVTGLQELYQDEIKPQFRKPDGPSHKTATGLELAIVGGPHDEERVFIGFLTASLSDGGTSGNKANLRYVFDAACPDGGSELGDMLGREFTGYLKPADNGKRMLLVYNTCAPIEAEPAAVTTPKDNPFRKTA